MLRHSLMIFALVFATRFGYFLIRLASQAAVGVAIPTAFDLDFPGLNIAGTAGVLALLTSSTPLSACPSATAKFIRKVAQLLRVKCKSVATT